MKSRAMTSKKGIIGRSDVEAVPNVCARAPHSEPKFAKTNTSKKGVLGRANVEAVNQTSVPVPLIFFRAKDLP